MRAHRVDARQLGQFLRQLLELAEEPAAFPLLPVDFPQQEVPVDHFKLFFLFILNNHAPYLWQPNTLLTSTEAELIVTDESTFITSIEPGTFTCGSKFAWSMIIAALRFNKLNLKCTILRATH